MGRRASLVAVLFAVGAVLLPTSANAIPAFARKYGVACSACHTNWPRLNRFGINFRDNGYRMNRERDNPVTQGPGYFPIAFRATVGYQYSNNTLTPVAPVAPNTNGLATTETGTFGFLGLDILTAGTLGEQIGFLLVVEAQLASANFNTNSPQGGDLESAWVVFTRLGGTPYANIRVGKGALNDLPNDQHRSYQLTQVYQIYFFQAYQSSVTYSPGDNYGGVEFYGHNELDNFRYSVALLNGNDNAVPWWSGTIVSNPTLWGHIQYYALTGNDILASIEPGIFGASGWQPTKGLTAVQTGTPVPCDPGTGNNCVSGTGYAMANYYRIGGELHMQFLSVINPLTLDVAVEYGSDSGSLIYGGSGVMGQNADGSPTRAANWLGGYAELSYTPNPDWTFVFLYNRCVMLQQGSTDYSPATGNFDSWDLLVRYNIAFSSRAAVALQAEVSQAWTTQVQGALPSGVGPPQGTTVLLAIDFAY
ncbi:MAG: hypothetical protein ACLPJH_17370 [Myxococcaceae bacterium]